MLFSTATLPPHQRREAWSHVLSSVCGPLTVAYGAAEAPVEAEMVLRSLAGLHCALITQNTLGVRRSRGEAARAEDQQCFLITQVRGRSRMTQLGNEAVLEPGDMTLIDSGRPSAFHFTPDNVQLSLHLPRAAIERQLRRGALPLAQPLRGGLAAVTGTMIRALFDHAAECSPSQGLAGREALMNLVLSTLFDGGGGDAGLPRQEAQLAALQRYMAAHLADPELSPHDIARAQGISVRHLHRLFQATGRSFSQWLRSARLARCAAELRDPARRHLGVTEIAFRWGFNDSAHFSRAFRTEFGESPSDCRAAVRTGGANQARPRSSGGQGIQSASP